MISEYEKYQNIKRTILLIAWKQIEESKSLETYTGNIERDLKELFDAFDLTHQKVVRLLEEIVDIDKWLLHPKDMDHKTNYSYYALTPNGRKEVDELRKSKADKVISWLKVIAPKVASYIDETIIKPAIQIGMEQTIKR